MSALEHSIPLAAAPRILGDRPTAARRRRAEDGALTEMARALLRDARAVRAPAGEASPEASRRRGPRALPTRMRCRPGKRARAGAAPVA